MLFLQEALVGDIIYKLNLNTAAAVAAKSLQ